MKTTTHLAVWGTVMAISLATTSAPVRAADDNAPASKSSTASDYSKAGPASSAFGQVERANKLIGKEVVSSDNQKLGKIDNIVVDLESGRILYAVVGSGGILKVGERRFAAPPALFSGAQTSASSTSSGTFGTSGNITLNVDKEKFSNAPQFTKDMDTDTGMGKLDFVSKVYQYFGQNAWWQGGAAASAETAFHNVHRAKDVIGTKVQNVNNEPMGKVDNLMLDLPAGRITYVILSPDSSLNLGNNLYALPPMLTLGSDQKTFTADITKDKLAGAPHFAKDNWSEISSPTFASQVYQYYGKQPYFGTSGGLQPTGPTDSQGTKSKND